ncbi:ABC-2 family transporter protein [candidate division WOR-3 bacterium]|nr:ABC-2 family transporter protein [candidate division WOR-3 bacterium]
MKKYVKVSSVIIFQNLKGFMADRGNFFTYLLTIVLYNALSLIFLGVVFSYIEDIRGWSFYELLFIYGFFTAVSGLFYTVFAWCLWFPESYIINGKLDSVKYLPVNSLYYIIVSELGNSFMEITSLVLGAAIIVFSSVKLHLKPDIFFFLKLVLSLVGSTSIMASYFIFFSALSFKIKSTSFFGAPFMEIIQFSQFPVEIFSKGLRVVITWVIPISFVAFFPSASLIRRAEYEIYYLITFSIGAGLFYLSVLFWTYNLKKYESVGN